MKIALVTDSTADIPPDVAMAYDIHVVPTVIIMDGKSLEDGKGLSRQEFYERLPQMNTFPTTAAPAAGAFEMLYNQLLQQGVTKIISIHVSSVLSGVYNVACLAAKTFKESVDVFDSGQVTLGLGYQVISVAEALKEGMDWKDIPQYLADLGQRARVLALLDTLEYVRRSGRVSWARARLGSLLQLKPLLEVNQGQVISLGEVRTRQKGISRLKELTQNLGPLERLAILHTNAEAEARLLLDSLDIPLPHPPLIVYVTTVIGTHVGPKGLGIAAIIK